MADEVIHSDDISVEPLESRLEQDDAAGKRAGREASAARLRLVWSCRRFVLRVTGIGLVLSVLIAFAIPKRFQSTARLMPPDQGSSGLGLAMLAAGGAGVGAQLGSSAGLGSSLGSIAGDLLGIKNSSDLFVGILQSRTVQDDLINKFDLRKVYSDRRMEDARDDLSKHTDFSADRKTGIITIQVVDNSPKQAATMAQEYLNELNLVVTQLNTSSAHRERVFLEERLSQVKQDLETAENTFSQFASKNTALDVPAQGRAMIEAAANLNGQLIAAQTELQGLKQIYSDGNVRVRSTLARVDELQRQLQKLGGKFDDASGSVDKEDQSMYPSIRQLPMLGVSYADLFRNTKIQETIFANLTQQYELAKVEEAKETPSIKVLDSPDIPGKKSFPPRMVIVLLGTMLAVTGSVMWVFGRQFWNQVDPGDPQKVLAQEIVHTLRVRMPWVNGNGSGPSSTGSKVRSRFRRNRDQTRSDT